LESANLTLPLSFLLSFLSPQIQLLLPKILSISHFSAIFLLLLSSSFLDFSSFFFLSPFSAPFLFFYFSLSLFSTSTILTFPALVFTTYYTPLNTLSSLLLLFSSQSQNYSRLAIAFPRLHSTSDLQLHWSLFSPYAFDNLHYILNRSLLIEGTIHISHIYWSFNFFNLNPCFLTNSELMTSFIAPLSNNASTVTPFYILILSKPIFIVTCSYYSDYSRMYYPLLYWALQTYYY